jgi:glycogen debranching enzyme
MDHAGAVIVADPLELLGYRDPSEQPEATGVDKLVLKRGNLFLVANRLGDVSPAGARDLGLFLTDTRHLSGWKMAVQGGPHLCLSSQVSRDYVAQIDFTVTSLHEGDLLGREPVNYVHLRRDMLIDDVLVDRLTLANFQGRLVEGWIELTWAADFADVFEIRGARRRQRGSYLRPQVDADRVLLRYDGRDGRRYATEIRIEGIAAGDSGPARLVELTGSRARIGLALEPTEQVAVSFVVAGGIERGAPGRVRGLDEERPLPRSGVGRSFEDRAEETHQAYDAFARASTRFVASHDMFSEALSQAVADLKALTVYHFGEPVISAGIPWFTCPFGRDALLAGYEALLATPEVARDALRFLARLQGERDDPEKDEEPGKIPHEIRFGEMAAAGEVPHTPYYGSADATPLFLVLLSEYDLWTDDRETVARLLPHAERALAWIDAACERGDGLVVYHRRTSRGLRNQGWKDSRDGVPFADGTPAEPPIALVEVQGYTIDARRRMADLFRRLGRQEEARALEEAAARHARIVEERFWMDRVGTYALALDGAGRQVDAVTSNPGHLLFSRAVRADRVLPVVRSLLAPGMWSGWGIRTLAEGQRAYNPLSYHDGTVWPHDNAICAMGFASHGLTREAKQVLTGMWDTAQHFRRLRLPELFCGIPRAQGQFPVHYPVACSPQAWSSAAWFLLLRAALGLSADAPHKVLRVEHPRLPPWLEEVTLENLRVGRARTTLRFTRGRSSAFAEVVAVEGGELKVQIEV